MPNDPNLIGPPAPERPPLNAQALLSMLMNQMDTDTGSMDELFKAFAERHKTAEQQAAEAGSQLGAARAAPMPQTSALADFAVRGLGSAAALFSGRDDPRAFAAKLIDDERKTMMAQRSEQLAALEDTYKRAADRAAKMDDIEAEVSFRDKLNKVNQDRIALHQTLGSMIDNEAKADQAKLDRENAFAIAKLKALTDIETTRMTVSVSAGAAKLPPDLAAKLAPFEERMKQLSQARGAIASDPKISVDAGKKRTKVIDNEYAALSEQYQSAIDAYYTRPAGSSGEAADTPLGLIVNRAKAKGAVTFEDYSRMVREDFESQGAAAKGYKLQSIIMAGVGMFPKLAEVSKAMNEYRRLTMGGLNSLALTSRKNRDRVDVLAAQLTAWGYPSKNSDELLNPQQQDMMLPETVVSPTGR